VSKKVVDNWLQVLSPSSELLIAYWNDNLFPAELNRVQISEEEKFLQFTNLYNEEMEGPEAQLCIRGLAQELNIGATLTLLCTCHSTAFCHRRLLRDILLEKVTELKTRSKS